MSIGGCEGIDIGVKNRAVFTLDGETMNFPAQREFIKAGNFYTIIFAPEDSVSGGSGNIDNMTNLNIGIMKDDITVGSYDALTHGGEIVIGYYGKDFVQYIPCDEQGIEWGVCDSDYFLFIITRWDGSGGIGEGLFEGEFYCQLDKDKASIMITDGNFNAKIK
jgi:hypothetical protein